MNPFFNLAAAVFLLGCGGAVHAQAPPAPFMGAPFSLGADIVPDSALDVSFLLDKPAGKRGTVRAQGERLVFADGSPAAFWGVNLCWDALYPPDAEGAKVARRLAMSGVNLVRLTYLDGGPHGLFRQDCDDTHTPETQRMARMDAFYAHLKRNGVYSLLVLGMGRRTLKPGDGVPAEKDATAAEAAYAVGRFFDPRIQQADQRVWHTLLTHVNPQTGLRLADDPAIAGIEILNEGSLFYRYDRFEHLPPPLKARIAMHWNRWLAARYGTRAALAAHWGRELPPNEDPTRGTVSLDFSFLDSKPTAEATAFPTRGADWNRFIADVCRDYYQNQIDFLRGLHVRQPISCNGGGSYSAADRWSNRAGDLFDQHQYHDHPNWSPYLTYSNRSSLRSGLGIIQSLARGRMAGMPYGITEFDFCYPNDWRAEGWVPFAAYARLQAWNFATAFAYSSEPWDDRAARYGPSGAITGVWRFHNDPAAFGQWPLTALIFLRGDVRPARETIDVHFSEADTFLPEPGRFPPDPLRFLEDVPLVHRTRQVYETDEKTNVPNRKNRTIPSGRSALFPARPPFPPARDGWRRSDTGELRYHADPGLFVIDTPRTQGVVGFTRAAPVPLRDITLTIENPFGSVVLTSLDGLPLSHSRRMLLTAIGRCQNTGFTLTQIPGVGGSSAPRYQANRDTLGTAPILIDPLRLTLTLRGGGKNETLTAFALDGAGNRIAELPLRRGHGIGGAALSTEGSPATIYYELLR